MRPMMGRSGSSARPVQAALSARMLAAWLGLHALLLPVLLPVFHHPTHIFASQAELATALVAMGDAGMAVHHAGHSGTHDGKAMLDCPLCLAMQHPAAFVSPATTAVTLPQSSALQRQSLQSAEAPRWHNFSARARGPPQRA